ncbi:MAG: hypothetical protein VX403_11495, partial [Planctomycetota bacterium]|nr:hypothetical protein [Planctomycetota bacterium]
MGQVIPDIPLERLQVSKDALHPATQPIGISALAAHLPEHDHQLRGGPIAGFAPFHAGRCADTLAWQAGLDELGGSNETPGSGNADCDGGGGGPAA